MTKAPSDRGSVLSWALYDWANSAFALVVVSVFFPVFLKQYWGAGSDASTSTLQLGIANSLAATLVALSAPVLGAIADRTRSRKASLAAFTSAGVVATAALAFVGSGQVMPALALFVLASVGFAAAGIFYDALIVDVAAPESLHAVSALGFGLGYLGGGLLFGLSVAMTLWPAHFGLPHSAAATRTSFVLVAAWWALFSLPLFLNVTEKRSEAGPGSPLASGWRRLLGTLRELRKHRVAWIFLAAYWCYIDGVYTMARMAVDYGLDLGFSPASLIVAILLTQLTGFPASLLFGRLGSRFGAKPMLYTGIAVYALACIWSFRMSEVREFYALAAAIGLVQGGVQSVSRSYFAGLVPAGRSGEFFGFFNMAGRFSAVVGPAVVGAVGAMTGNPRFAVLAILLLFIAGAGLLSFAADDENAASMN
ncbi:MAG TPA: MFS transporter [Burkholderiales bacterium]|nr:MFS transporter [Burkholderiales bacterium]